MVPDEVLTALSVATVFQKDQLNIAPLAKGGLINHSFKMTEGSNGRSWLLQKINTGIFKEPMDLSANYQALYEFSKQWPGRIRIPLPVFFEKDQLLFFDNNRNAWRAMEWIQGSYTIEKVESKEQAAEVARTFALFTLALSKDFKAEKLMPALPHFHDLSLRYQQFEEALTNSTAERLQQAGSLPSEMISRKTYCRLFERFKNEPANFPLRVMHHDAKIANILFEGSTGKVWGPIDLDTVMPGYFFSDLGDMIRSLAGSLDENASEISSMRIREDIYEELAGNYSSVMEIEWTSEEKKFTHASGLILVYMQTLRFLADHLNGDIYYKINYTGQNLDRAKNQFRLLTCLEEYLREKYAFSV